VCQDYGVGDAGEQRRLFRIVDHRGRGAGREQYVGHKVRRHGVGKRLNERTFRAKRCMSGDDLVLVDCGGGSSDESSDCHRPSSSSGKILRFVYQFDIQFAF
jgi:hypothetical protein